MLQIEFMNANCDCARGHLWCQVKVGSNNGLVQQAITWTIVDPDLCGHIYGSQTWLLLSVPVSQYLTVHGHQQTVMAGKSYVLFSKFLCKTAAIFQTTFIFKCIFLNENVWISFQISLKFAPEVRIDNIPALVQIMAWSRPVGLWLCISVNDRMVALKSSTRSSEISHKQPG